eukprot:2948159-Amphidinium_carterae.1
MDSPLDRESLKGQPTEATCDPKLLQKSKDTKTSWEMLKAISAYLFRHIELSVKVKPVAYQLVAYSDISFAPGGSRSQAGTLVQWGGSNITWRSFRQSLTVSVTCESELAGVMDAYESAKWCVQVLLGELAYDLVPRHTSIRTYRLTEAVNQGSALLGWVGIKDQKSDYLTKLAPKMYQRACIDALEMGWVSE